MSQIRLSNNFSANSERVSIVPGKVAYSEIDIRNKLLHLNQAIYVVQNETATGVCLAEDVTDSTSGTSVSLLAHVQPMQVGQFGDPEFMRVYGINMAYMTGAMANGIASEELVIASGKKGLLSSFGAAGLVPSRIEEAINKVQQALPNGPYAFNLIHSPSEDAIERAAVDLFLKHGVKTVEASAFLGLTQNIVRYRVAGLRFNGQNQIEIGNRVIAKISRTEVASKFMAPAPEAILRKLVAVGSITGEQAQLAENVPMADDITVEADSGGHTDNRPLVLLLPAMLALREQFQSKHDYAQPIRIGAAGGIGTPSSALAAFMMGAAYVATGSVNQSCVEAAASAHTKNLLAQAEMTDVTMAPAADMFEMGVELQVLKRGTMFPMRAKKLYELYKNYESIEAIPLQERLKLEQQVFRSSLDEIWRQTEEHFNARDPHQIERAKDHPKRKMALIFRWYLGLSSRWSNSGEQGREADYQIWAGPAMGAFNNWVKGSYLEQFSNRKAVEVGWHIMTGAAYMYRLRLLQMQGVWFPSACEVYTPQPFSV
ncbi:MAG TPA: PfaD family polyunsaturated fatty acid/polyketide biosynthesis protein [Candidatus Lambdaproteobacteria bacterium]|nr:PfaD family polyunsaturated fatty acid/polyketide biosynthesis protein [SAR324 cluster bacterium]HBL56230.1 2-nitropropane dioxygenase [Deltaproteobacteria bacterium]HHZ78282.1 PfaD family polyunsaturated fatty acid/polyketide biosynthesis protein [Candidatus Lambdaproteobacteria bacterium]HIA57580.1 PfaD family polyunsaturated fatty acid/polyketide biosynthesis protein [Candidatus Lambdaproteobacteria bacterium]HIB45049.1 PfaD family polyunsaturated fatty acid/polyketide biosynthesis protei